MTKICRIIRFYFMPHTLISLSPDDFRQVIREEVERAVGRSAPALTPPTQPQYLPITQAAERHGVSKSYLYRLSSQRVISTRRVGKAIQFDAGELDAHFDKTAKPSQTVVDAELKQRGVFPTLKGKRHV